MSESTNRGTMVLDPARGDRTTTLDATAGGVTHATGGVSDGVGKWMLLTLNVCQGGGLVLAMVVFMF